jgi:SAM-dependent methyltransferase/DNA-binding CsgD family transcriptional regulator
MGDDRRGGAPSGPLPEEDEAFLEALSVQARGFMESRALLTALELDLFTAVGKGGTAAEIAARLGGNARGAGALLHHLVAAGYLVKEGETFRNRPRAARYLVTGAPESVRGGLLHMVHLWTSWSQLTESVRTGAPAARPERGEEGTESFIAAMHRNASVRAPSVVRAVGTDGVRRMLDVGGGSGAYSIAFALATPGLQVEVLDQADVVPIAQRHIDAAGLAGRVRTRVGDLRADEFGAGYDLVLLSAVCHMLGPDEVRDLLRRAAACLAPGGRVVVQDHVLRADKTGPRPGTLFALNMLVNTVAGGNYSEDEYRAWMTDAGLADVAQVALPGPTALMVGRKK